VLRELGYAESDVDRLFETNVLHEESAGQRD
jgi:hypothetical protein